MVILSTVTGRVEDRWKGKGGRGDGRMGLGVGRKVFFLRIGLDCCLWRLDRSRGMGIGNWGFFGLELWNEAVWVLRGRVFFGLFL